LSFLSNDLDDVAFLIIDEWDIHAIKNQMLTEIRIKGIVEIN
jgi:hypothetical protein